MADNLTVSLEKLRAELGELELRIVDRINDALDKKADQAVIEQLDQRVQSLELSRAAREHITAEVSDQNDRINKLERFRYAVPSVAFISMLATLVMVAYYLTR